MPNLTSAINVNVDKNIKDEANTLFNSLGLNMSTAINMFLRKSISVGGIPFEIRNPKPSKELIEALQEGEDILSGKIKAKGYHNINELMEDLEK